MTTRMYNLYDTSIVVVVVVVVVDITSCCVLLHAQLSLIDPLHTPFIVLLFVPNSYQIVFEI